MKRLTGGLTRFQKLVVAVTATVVALGSLARAVPAVAHQIEQRAATAPTSAPSASASASASTLAPAPTPTASPVVQINDPLAGSFVSQCQYIDVSLITPPLKDRDYWIFVSDEAGLHYVQRPLVRRPITPGNPMHLVATAWVGDSSTTSATSFYIDVVSVPQADSDYLQEKEGTAVAFKNTWATLGEVPVHRNPGGSTACPPL